MGIVKKDFITRYWSIDSTIATPFTRTVISRNEFENLFAFLHFCDNSEYATKGQPGYNPKKKLGFTYEKLVESFCNIWLPCKNIAIDEKVGFTLNVIMQTNQTNMGLRTLKYVIHLMRTAVC